MCGSLVLVTGASGFIGKALCEKLKYKNTTIRVMLRNIADGPWDEVIVGDVSKQLPEELMIDVDTIFHLAGKAHALSETSPDEKEYFQVNTEGTRKLLESSRAAGVRRFIFISSVKAMGEGGERVQDETDECRPMTPYGKSKLAAERLVLEGGYVPEPVVLRLSMVYGPTSKGNLPRMIKAVANRRFPPVPEVGNKRSMVHVDDVVQAALLAAEKPEPISGTYIVTDGQVYSTRQMYELVCEALDKPVSRLAVPRGMLVVMAAVGDLIGKLRGKRFIFDSDSLEKLLGSAVYSTDKIENELGFVPTRDLRVALPDIMTHIELR